MSHIADLIKSTQAAKVAALDKLNVCIKSMETADVSDELLNKALLEESESLNSELEMLTKKLDTYNKSEQSLFGAAPAIIHHRGDHKDPASLLVKSAVGTLEAYLKRVPLAQVLTERYGSAYDFEQVQAVSGIVTNKAAQNPAMTNVATWAQELTRVSYAAFMDLLTPESVVANLPMARYNFDGFSSIVIPNRADRSKTLSGSFRAEGAPIRVGAAVLGSLTLTPKSMGVIGTFTNELFRRSTPNIEAAIRKWMLEDTSITLDTTFLDNIAGSALRPAGISNNLGGNSVASTGDTSADITADVRGMLQRMASAMVGRRPVWIMNPARFIGVQLSLTPAGTLAFPEAQQGRFLSYPVTTSMNVADDEVFLVDAAELAFAGGIPEFFGTEVASIMEDDTAPGAIDAPPSRSLYQTNSSALRCVWELDWYVMRAGSVQQLTAVSW